MSADIQREESDFSELMSQLAAEAQRIPDSKGQKKSEDPAARELANMLRPMAEGIQALGRAVMANTSVLMSQAENQRQLPELLAALNANLEDRKAVSKKVFDALHEELRGYKDAFLFEALQKPVVLDLITLFDDLSKAHQEYSGLVEKRQGKMQKDAAANSLLPDFEKMLTRVDHATHSVLEILRRLEVEQASPLTGKLDKQQQRVMLVEPAESAAQDNDVVRSVKPGFIWRGRLVRPEEVVIRKYSKSQDTP